MWLQTLGNLAAGALRQKHRESGKANAEDLRFYAYDVKFPNASNRNEEVKIPQTNDMIHRS